MTNEVNPFEEEFQYYEKDVYAFILEKLGFCTCGPWLQVGHLAHEYLKLKSNMQPIPMDNSGLLVMMYVMDSQGFTIHGGSVWGAWLSDKGKQLLDFCEKHLNIEEKENE